MLLFSSHQLLVVLDIWLYLSVLAGSPTACIHFQIVLSYRQLLEQGLDGRHERVLKGLKTTLAWRQEYIVLSGVLSKIAIVLQLLLSMLTSMCLLYKHELFAVQCYKRAHKGCLPLNTRRLCYKATEEGCGFITTPLTLQADLHELHCQHSNICTWLMVINQRSTSCMYKQKVELLCNVFIQVTQLIRFMCSYIHSTHSAGGPRSRH